MERWNKHIFQEIIQRLSLSRENSLHNGRCKRSFGKWFACSCCKTSRIVIEYRDLKKNYSRYFI